MVVLKLSMSAAAHLEGTQVLTADTISALLQMQAIS
jgi:hypothetical protein